MFLNREFLDLIAEILLSVFRNYPKAELVIVMIIVPTMLNGLQFWITDEYLKNKKSQAKVYTYY